MQNGLHCVIKVKHEAEFTNTTKDRIASTVKCGLLRVESK